MASIWEQYLGPAPRLQQMWIYPRKVNLGNAMREIIPIPTFRTVEDARAYAQIHKPYKTALENFQNRDAYRRYGEGARTIAMRGWECASKGDMAGLIKQSKLLSYALPAWCFDYEKRA